MAQTHLEDVRDCCTAIKQVPRSPEFNMKALHVNHLIFELLPDEEKTGELSLAAVKLYGYLIQYVPNPTEEMKLEAVKNYGRSLEYITSPSREICLEAVKQDGRALKFVPRDLRDEEICMIALRNEGSIHNVPPSSMNAEIYRIGITQDFFDLSEIPEEHRTEEICKTYQERLDAYKYNPSQAIMNSLNP